MYRYKINKLILNNLDEQLDVIPKRINVIVGPNNSGKSRLLKDIRDLINGREVDRIVLKDIDVVYPSSYEEINEGYDIDSKIFIDSYRQAHIRSYTNRQDQEWHGFSSIDNINTSEYSRLGTSYIDEFNQAIAQINENNLNFYKHFGCLFQQYLGTEERLTICKEQTNHGLGAQSTNFLSAYQFRSDVLNDLSYSVNKVFKEDILLDPRTLGNKLVFRIAENLDEFRNNLIDLNDEKARQLNKCAKLDDQGDGLKSYVSTFLALNDNEKDILLLDEPEAFLHPPLAYQLGELIGNTSNDKQIYVATHSIDILKGILAVCDDVNVIRITRPSSTSNEIKIINDEYVKNILNNPLFSVSRILEGLFVDKVVLTEAEADETIYQNLVEKLYPQNGLYFAHGQNKQTLADIAKIYKKIGIKYEIIVDFDILRKSDDFKKFINIIDIDDTTREKYYQWANELRSYIDNEVSLVIDDDKKKEQRSIKYHKEGINCINDESIKKNIETIIDELSNKYHIHILKTGELETILVKLGITYTTNKNNWFIDAIKYISSHDSEEIKKDTYLDTLFRNITKN